MGAERLGHRLLRSVATIRGGESRDLGALASETTIVRRTRGHEGYGRVRKRNTTRIQLIVASSALLISCASGMVDAADAEEPDVYIVSLVQLLTQPLEFHNRVVRVSGFLAMGFDLRLYLTGDHAKISDVPSSVRIEVPSEQLPKCAGSYVTLEGLVKVPSGSGPEIVKTMMVDRWSSGKVPLSTCWKREVNG